MSCLCFYCSFGITSITIIIIITTITSSLPPHLTELLEVHFRPTCHIPLSFLSIFPTPPNCAHTHPFPSHFPVHVTAQVDQFTLSVLRSIAAVNVETPLVVSQPLSHTSCSDRVGNTTLLTPVSVRWSVRGGIAPQRRSCKATRID
jgi:hypothetical protein